METILWIIGGAAVLFGLLTFIFSDSSNPKDRATEAAGAAGAGAIGAIGCLLQLIIPAIMLLVGLWLLGKIFG